ncbi:MAG: hypothetical protein KDK36_05070 [Leptospiraceae bacterium]|nr:hypothetical protein [Leptospiraceae bacterium]
MALSPERLESLKTLSSILRNCSSGEVRNILSEMDKDIWLDPESMLWLRYNLFHVSDLIKDLAVDDLKLVLSKINKESLKAFFVETEKRDHEIYLELLEIFPDWKKKEKTNSVTIEDLEGEVISTLNKLISEGRVGYNGILLYLYPPPCRPEGRETGGKGETKIIVLNPFPAMKDPLDILIYCPGGKSIDNFRISVQSRWERYFDSDTIFKNFTFNGYKIYIGRIYPEWKEPGLATIWADIEEIGEVSKTIYITNGTSSKGDIQLLESRYNEKEFSFQFKIIPEEKNKITYLRYTIYCTRCGVPLYSSVSKDLDKSVNLNIPLTGTILDHKEDLLFILQSENSSYSFLYNRTVNSNDYNNYELTEEFDPLEKFKLKLNKEDYTKFKSYYSFYHLSNSKAVSSSFLNSIYSDYLNNRRGAKFNYDRKESPLEIAKKEEDVFLFSPNSDFQMISLNSWESFRKNKGKLSLPVPLKYRVNDLYINLFQYNKDKILLYKQFHSPVSKKPQIIIDSPSALFEGDSIDIDIYVIPQGGKFFYIGQNGKEELDFISGKYTYRVIAGKDYEFHYSKDDILLIEKINIPIRKILETNIKVLSPGDTIDKKNLFYYNSPTQLMEKLMEENLFTYVWGCSEQTSAKLAGWVLLFKGEKEDKHILERIDQGLEYLKKFRKTDGHFTYFNEEKSSPRSTASVYKNLSLVKDRKEELVNVIPEYFKLLDELQKLLMDYEVKGVGRSESQLTEIFTNIDSVKKLIEWEDDKFKITTKGFYSLEAILFYCYKYLLEENKDELEIFSSYKKKETILYSSGIKGLLEKLNLSKPKVDINYTLRTRKVDEAKKKLLEQLEISYCKDSFPSTFDTISVISLLNYLLHIGHNFSFEEIEDKVKILSDHTIVLQTTEMESMISDRNSPLKIQKMELDKGENLILSWNMGRITTINNYYLYIPPLFEFENDRNVDILRLNPSFGRDKILLKSIRKGIGKVFLLEEDTYNTSNRRLIELGKIRVV